MALWTSSGSKILQRSITDECDVMSNERAPFVFVGVGANIFTLARKLNQTFKFQLLQSQTPPSPLPAFIVTYYWQVPCCQCLYTYL